MRTGWKLMVVVLVAAMCGAIGKSSSASSQELLSALNPLEGSTWTVKLIPDEAARKKGAKEIEDTFTFSGGKLTIANGLGAGAAGGEFEVDNRRGNMPLWKAAVRGNNCEIRFMGRLEAGSLQAEAMWDDGAKGEMRFNVRGSKGRAG